MHYIYQYKASGRRWDGRGAWRTIMLMWRLRWLYWRGVSADRLAAAYRPSTGSG